MNRIIIAFLRSFLRCFVLGGIFLMPGCDSAPGPEDLSQSAPELRPATDFITPEVIDSQMLAVVDGRITTSISVQFSVSDADNDLSKAFVIVQSPVAGQDAVGELEFDIPGNGHYSVQVSVTFDEGAAGLYQVVAFAADAGGRMSNRVFGMLQVTSGSEPPVITLIEIPSQVSRPAAGQPAICVKIIAHVTDPDGADNVLRVEVIVNGAVTLQLRDDGAQGSCPSGIGGSGDATSGDGQFTLTITLDSDNKPGDNIFEFTAIDRSGLRSETLTRIIKVD